MAYIWKEQYKKYDCITDSDISTHRMCKLGKYVHTKTHIDTQHTNT